MGNWMRSILMVAMIWIITGSCSPPVIRYVVAPLQLPVRPVLPSVTADDLRCLSVDVYKRVVTRDLMRRQYAERLEAIIMATTEKE